ncbi:hypothetical protein ACWD4B_22240 [Streptomyces sp. NPDC002536]
MHQLEEAASSVLRTYEKAHLVVLYLATILLVGVPELIINGLGMAVVLSRALIIWLGLALLSGRLFGRKLSWILPVATVFPLTYLNQDDLGRPRWWDWTGQTPSSSACWAIAAIGTLLGVMAFYLTPWRTRAVRHQ